MTRQLPTITTATRDPFFASPTTGFDTAPGEILRRRTVATRQLRVAARAWQLVYASRTDFGSPIAASGIVLTPDTSNDHANPLPLVVFVPMFHGLGGTCAPSQLLAGAGPEPEASLIGSLLKRGWVVAVPDGHGLGVTGIGPARFLAGKAAGHAVLDLARAVAGLPELGAHEAAVTVWGYADGGRAAVWAAEQQPSYAPEVDLRGVVAGAVAADPASLIPLTDGGPWAGLAVAGLIGLARTYAHLPVAHTLTESGYQMAEKAAGMDAAQLLVTFRNQTLGHWCERPDPWHDPMWRHLLGAEITGRGTPQVPVHLYHGVTDALIPIGQAFAVHESYRDRGVEVTWDEYLTGHAATIAAGADDAIDRLATLLPHPRRSRRHTG
ncbi:hypothetical protein IU438_18710 [Nocardia cyriacigeorgica]|uniref:lipase family protein n=1 Tax=Nocardia cyriacigeorgica TaxID=135487 RepID=UPI0018939D2F|nr:lipase family protein [Nocardia cyriacigeorgica]MBF6397824.1 hypothetical protein [Nocardia cyriacigeorgica]MBF6402518.1 hypothetical protein [Nocardia cyriacigeorgica]